MKVEMEKAALCEFLEYQRVSIRAILADLDEPSLRTPVLPSGWSPLGLVEHLGHAERHWFQEVFRGSVEPLPWPDENTPLRTTRSPRQVFGFYRDQCDISDAIIAAAPLSATPRAGIPTRRWLRRPPTCDGSFCTSSRRPLGTPVIWTPCAS